MKLVLLSGGVGGARMARGFVGLAGVETTVVVNVGDDATVHGLEVSPDLDTVVYTLAGLEGPQGWGRNEDTFRAMEELARFGVDTEFRVGDLDLALNLFRTGRLAEGWPLSRVTTAVTRALGLTVPVLPVSDDQVRTMVEIEAGWIDFQTYFVKRRHTDPVLGVRFVGEETARPAPGVMEAIAVADAVVISPSNPVLSIWPLLAVKGIREAMSGRKVMAVSPLIGGRAVKGPAVEAMIGLGLEPSPAGLVAAYRGLVTDLVLDRADQDWVTRRRLIDLVKVWTSDTMIAQPAESRRLAKEMLVWLG